MTQHYTFLVDDQSFDTIYARILQDGIEHWADPQMTLPSRINTNHGGRGVYFRDPAGHSLEILTRPMARPPDEQETRRFMSCTRWSPISQVLSISEFLCMQRNSDIMFLPLQYISIFLQKHLQHYNPIRL